MKKQILKILRQIFVKEKKEIPLGVEAAGLDMQAEKIAKELSDVGYRGPISLDFIKRIQQASKPTYTKVWPKQSADVLDMTGKKIHPDETIIGGKGYKVETEAEIKSRLEGMNKKTIDRIRRRRYEAALKEERRKMAEDPFYIQKIIDPDDFAEGGRVPFIFGGGAIKTAFGRLKDLKKMKHGEKMLKKNPLIQHLLSTADKQTLKGLETQFSEQLLKMLKKDRELMLHLQSNKAMKDEGLDFLMKKMQEDFAPHIKKYKSIEEIDAAILNMENIIKNRVMKEGRKPNAYGGLAGMLGEPTYADGGRIGFKKGFSAGRRKFLKTTGAGGLIALLSTIPGIGKIFKPFKALTKSKVLTQVPIKDIAGMPAWFKPLVNKVIKEGTEVSSGAERVIVHKTKLPNSKTDVYVEQSLDTGDVAVDIGMGKHGWADGHYGQPVRLEYKAAEDIMSGPSDEPFKVGVRDPLLREKVSIHEDLVKDIKPGKEGLRLKPGKTKEEFWVEEAEFSGGHPENIKFEESTFEKFGEHGSNFDEVEKFATGKVKKSKPTKKKLRTEYESGKAEADAEAYWDEHGDFASGGRVPFFLGGRYPEGAALLRNMIRYFAKESKHGKKPSEYLKISNPKQYQKLLNDLSMYKKYSPGEGIMAPDMIKDMIKKTGVERAGVIEHIIGAARNIKKADDSTAAYTKTVVDDLVKKGADKKTAEMFADSMSKAVTKGIGPKNTPKITDQGLLELETIYKNMLMKEGRKLNATGGRVSLSAGGLAGMLGE